MKRFTLPIMVALLATFIGAGAALAQARTFRLDGSHTEVGFDVRHIFTKVRGQFNEFEGTIIYDPENLKASSVEVIIQSNSVFTANERRDGHLKTDDFFWAEKHPTLTFKSTQVIPGESKENFQVEGDLTIRGVTKTVVLDVEFLGMGEVSIGDRSLGTRAGFFATTSVNRKDFGIVWNKTLDQGGVMVGETVNIVLNVEAVSMKPKAAAEKT